jgi:acetate kinase
VELLTDRDYLEKKKQRLMKKKSNLLKHAGPSGEKSDVSYDDMPRGTAQQHEAAAVCMELMRINSELAEVDEQLQDLDDTIVFVQQIADSDWPIRKKVLALRDDVGMRLVDIADLLCVSYEYVRHISSC